MDSEIRNLRDDLKEVKSDIKELLQRTARLDVKSTVWGFFGGAIPVIIGLGIWFLRSQ